MVQTDVDDANAFVAFEEPQRHRHVLELLRPQGRSTRVLLLEQLAGQHLDERYQTQSVRQIRLQVGDVLVHHLHQPTAHTSQTYPISHLRQSPLYVCPSVQGRI